MKDNSSTMVALAANGSQVALVATLTDKLD